MSRPKKRRASRSRFMTAGIVAALVLGGGTALWWGVPREPSFAVPTFGSPQSLDPAVRDALAAAVERARSEPGAETVGALGRLYHAHELTDLAETCYVQAVRLDPGRPEWPYYLGRLAADSGDVARAAELLQAVTRLAPDFAPAWYHLGVARLAEGDADGADAAFARYATLDPASGWGALGKAKAALRRERFEDAMSLLREAEKLGPRSREVAYLRATTAARLGHDDEAAVAFARFGTLPDLPAPPDAWMNRVAAERTGTLETLRAAQRHEAAGEADRAATLYREVLTRESDNYAALVGLGQLQRRQRRVDEAEELLLRAVAVDPGQAHAHALLAGLKLETGRYAEGEAHAAEAVRLDPGAANAQFYLGSSRVVQDRCDAALAPLARSVELEPRLLDARIALAACHRRAGRLAEARAQLERVLAVAPGHPAARAAIQALDGAGGSR